MDEEKGRMLYLDVPQKEGKEGYVGTLFSLILRTGSILADANFKDTDMRVEYMTHFLISLIPNPQKRKEIRAALKKDIEERIKEDGSGDQDTKARSRNMVCLEYIGIVGDFIDTHIGLSVENRLGFVAKPWKAQ